MTTETEKLPWPKTDAPGPGKYSPKKKSLKKSPQHSMGKRRSRKAKKSQQPGPAKYTPVRQTLQGYKKIEYSIGTKKEIDYDNKVPGPGSYVQDREPHAKQKINYAFKRAPRVAGEKKETPGPGAYEKNGKGFLRDSNKMNIAKSIGKYPYSYYPNEVHKPGPGTYEQQPRPQTGYAMSGNGRGGAKREQVPGPGHYSPRRPKTGKAVNPPQSERFPDDKWARARPGPGMYDPHKGLKKLQ